MRRAVVSHENIQIAEALLGGTRLNDLETRALESLLRFARRERVVRLGERQSEERAPIEVPAPPPVVEAVAPPARRPHPWRGEGRADVARVAATRRARAAL